MTDVVRLGEEIHYERAVGVIQMFRKNPKNIVYVVIDVKVISFGSFHEAVEYSV